MVQSLTSTKWRGLTSDERAPYEALSADDRRRYEKETAVRDEMKLKELQKKQLKNSIVETETRMRGSTIANTKETESAAITVHRRELTENEKQIRNERRAAKEKEDNIIKSQHSVNNETRAQQAEARLKVLLPLSLSTFCFFTFKHTFTFPSSTFVL